jgi:transmembrane sensor
MNASRFEIIAGLLKKQLTRELTNEEKTAWEQWLDESPENRDLAERLQDPERLTQDLKMYYESKENILSKIRESIPELRPAETKGRDTIRSPFLFRHRQLLKYAAAVLILISLGGIFWFNQKKPVRDAPLVLHQQTIQPGTNKAFLTLSNGSRILLDSSHQGLIANEAGTAISVKDNQVSYQVNNDSGKISYNTMTTPRGGQYKLLLPDGSAVWLNAQSSITYPVRFTEKDRKVSITGEVYFEVAKDPVHPFIVDVNSKASVEVLGTHFNVNAYDEEPSIHTTLLEGSVLIRSEKYNQILKPNQQAQSNNPASVQVINLKENDINEVMAWKNGSFYFVDADINTVMRQLARWYDFDVTYTGEVKEKFHLEMQRNTHVENALKILEETRGVHFKIEGKKITVMP